MEEQRKRKRKAALWLACLAAALLLGFGGTGFSSRAAGLPRLKVSGTKLVYASGAKKGKAIQLKGVSTHGLSWFPDYVNQKAFTYMKKNWKINTVRLAMYTAEYNGYCTGDANNRKTLERLVDNGVKYAKKAGLYAIIDWHILSDGNPQTYQKQAVAFFKKMAKKYRNTKTILMSSMKSVMSRTAGSRGARSAAMRRR